MKIKTEDYNKLINKLDYIKKDLEFLLVNVESNCEDTVIPALKNLIEYIEE